MSGKPGKGRVCVIGLDGITFHLLRPWLEEGKLPTFARLMAEGSYGVIRARTIEFSEPNWTTFVTGREPAEHSIWDYFQPQRGSYEARIVDASLCQSPPLWRILSERGRTVGVMNVPVTFPPEVVNGWLVAGLDTHDLLEKHVYPSALWSEIMHIASDYSIVPRCYDKSLREYVAILEASIMARGKVALYLYQHYPCDFFMMVFRETDAIQHLCYGASVGREDEQRQAMERIYRALDAFLSEVIALLPNDTTLIVSSDHGSGPILKSFYFDRWLAQLGLLAEQQSDPAARRGNRVSHIGATLLKEAYSLVRPHLPEALLRPLKRFPALQGRIGSLLAFSQIDWGRTRAFTYPGNLQGIYINLRGRQPLGIVALGAEYEQLCAELTTALYALRDPQTSEPLVARVYRKEECFPGPYADLAPDLYIHWTGERYIGRLSPRLRSEDESLFVQPRLLGLDETVPDRWGEVKVARHTLEGAFFIRGERVIAGKNLGQLYLADVAPMILELMGEEPLPKQGA